MLVCDNISTSFDDRIIFKNLGFCLYPGSLLSIVGKNGSGKTSLLKIIAGLFVPDHGKVFYNNQETSKNYESYYQNLNYISHKNSINKELSVLDNLTFLATIRGNKILVPVAIKYFNLEEIIDLAVSKLSAGWQRRVSLARLICCNAKIWLLDEPENNLDSQGKILLCNLIKTRVAQNGIVIISSHNQDWLDEKILLKLNMEDYGCKKSWAGS